MRIGALSVGVMATLLLGAGPALAFEETNEAPPAVLQVVPDAKDPAMQLQTPAPTQAQARTTEKSGTKLFGFSILPKLDFEPGRIGVGIVGGTAFSLFLS